jgi:hypothetical protein
MSGDVDNVAVWAEADVLLGPLAAINPIAGADFALTGTDPWGFAGILDGSAGFTESQSVSSTDHTGWGVGVVATTRKDLSITRTFTALEDNEETLRLRYNTDGIVFVEGGYSGDLAGRDLQDKFKIAFEVRSGDVIKRVISKNYAQIETLGDVSEGEDSLARLPVTVKIYPEIVDGVPVYWETYKGAAA